MPPRKSGTQGENPAADDVTEERNDALDEDFQSALRELLEAYKPALEEDLKQAGSAEALIKESLASPPSCEDEFTRANALFARFANEETALRLLPVAAREFLGPVDRWRWCLVHLRCCLVFGWLICRSHRTFRASTYYLYRYWRCVREAIGSPVANPPTAIEREDFLRLVQALASAYKPYLRDQLASVEFPTGIPDEVIGGGIDCLEGEDAQVRILEQLLTTDTAAALLGRDALAKHRVDPFFWFCRCWCLCAIRLGCCLARARSLRDVVRCLRSYRRCLSQCFRRLHCAISSPTDDCIRGFTDILPGRILQPVIGDADGSIFGRYIIEVRDPGGDLLTNVVIYPNAGGNPDVSAAQGNFVVSGGTLGWIDVKKAAQDAGVDLITSTTFTITLRVFGTDGSELHPSCTTTFTLSVNETFIKQISGATSANYIDPDEPLRNGAALATIGGGMHVRGAANVYGCDGEKIEEYTIWAVPDPAFTFAQPAPYTAVAPGINWVQVSHIEYTPQTIAQPMGGSIAYTADQVRAYNVLDGDPVPSILTNVWGTRDDCINIVIDSTIVTWCWRLPSLIPSGFNSSPSLLPFRLSPGLHVGGTGKFTFLLQVIDTNGNQFYDIQRAWIDNEPIHAIISGIGGVPACSDLYTMNHGGAFKTVSVDGTAWDELIEPGNLTRPTSDNFDQYTLHFAKQGIPGAVPLITSTSTVPARPLPLGIGSLVSWNLQTLDKLTNPLMLLPPLRDHLLERGESCTYNLLLNVWDKTLINDGGSVHYSGQIMFPIKIINGPEP